MVTGADPGTAKGKGALPITQTSSAKWGVVQRRRGVPLPKIFSAVKMKSSPYPVKENVRINSIPVLPL